MSIEKYILLALWAYGFSLFFIIPKDRIRLAITAFLSKQFITWPFGLIVVEKGWIEYPIRFFSEVNRGSFTFEYFLFPMTCVIFNVHYPYHRNGWIRFGYYFLFCTVLTVIEEFFQIFSNLIHYNQWHWSLSWVTLFTTFWMTRMFCKWFFYGFRKGMDQ